MLIYKFTNKLNGKVYIGQTIGKLNIRVSNHLSESKNNPVTHFHQALSKYGIENFNLDVLEKNVN